MTTCSRADAGADCNYPFLTQKERDNETGLDYFLARYYSSTQGRFISPDPLPDSARRVEAQSWNRYTYALNNPLRYVDPTGEDYKDLSVRQRALIDDWARRQNEANEMSLSAQEMYNGLDESQRGTFEADANALENTTIIGKDGTKMNGLDAVKSVNFINGETPVSESNPQRFRIMVELKEGAYDFIMNAKNFSSVPGHGEDYPDSRQQKGGVPGLQFSMSRDGKRADVDVDYESKNPFVLLVTLCSKHCTPTNSDVRAGKHFDKHNKRFGQGPAGPLKKRYEPKQPK